MQFDTDSDKHHDLVANQGGVYGLGEKPEHRKTLHKTTGKDDEIVAKQDFSSKEKKQKRDSDKERKKASTNQNDDSAEGKANMDK